MNSAFTIRHDLPSAEAFKSLRNMAGWGDISLRQAQQVIGNSLHGITAYDRDMAIGMARIIGDGVINTYIQDAVSSFSFLTRPDKDYGAGMFAKLADLTDGTLS